MSVISKTRASEGQQEEYQAVSSLEVIPEHLILKATSIEDKVKSLRVKIGVGISPIYCCVETGSVPEAENQTKPKQGTEVLTHFILAA